MNVMLLALADTTMKLRGGPVGAVHMHSQW